MTSKEKALELYQKYHTLGSDFTRGVSMNEFAKQCALIAVDTILSQNISTPTDYGASWAYWQQVKDEIEKI